MISFNATSNNLHATVAQAKDQLDFNQRPKYIAPDELDKHVSCYFQAKIQVQESKAKIMVLYSFEKTENKIEFDVSPRISVHITCFTSEEFDKIKIICRAIWKEQEIEFKKFLRA